MSPKEVLRAIGAPVVLGVVLGAAGGWLWWTWWGPAPDGKVYDTAAGPHWYPDPFDPGITRDFSGTADFVVIAFGLALLLGVVGGWFARDRPLVGLAAAGVGSVVAAALMTVIGLVQSPSDPQAKVDQVKIGTELPGHLEVSGWTPYLAWPVGCLLGYLVVMLALNSRTPSGEWQRPGQPSAEPALQD
ncbi:MAG TPA: hypothetical protein VM575_10255 [Nocardioides sp.]|nr:hypothetical protein [Nocardioides sp.]